MENPTENQTPPPDQQTPPANLQVIQSNINELLGSIRSKGSWFFWIAGLSLINTFLASKGTYFIVGLAMTQFVDAIMTELTGDVNYIVSLIVPAIFAVFGYFALKVNRWAFIVGALLYILDGLLYLYVEAWLAAGFHVYVLYHLYRGYRDISAYEEEVAKLS